MSLALIAAACEPASAPARSPSPSPWPAVDPWSAYPVGWTELPPPPEEHDGSAWLWDGSDVLVAGGCDPDVSDRCRETRTAFAFDPELSAWRSIHASAEPMAHALGTWTGTEAIFLEAYGKGPIEGQAYDPETDSWRAVAPAPLDRGYGVRSVWTGRGLIVLGGADPADEAVLRAAAYDPATDTWRRLASAPIGLNLSSAMWTGHRVLVFGSLLNRQNRAATPTAVGAEYDPETDSWRTMPPSALSPQATSAGWVGGRMVAWDYQAETQVYDPRSHRWTAPFRMPISAGECYPDSTVVAGFLFAWFCGRVGLYDEVAHGWQRIEGGPLDDTIYAKAYKSEIQLWRFADLVPAGSAVALPMEGITLSRRGEACYGCEGSPRSLWVYRPPNEIVPTDPVREPGKAAVHRAVSNLFYAWSVQALGLLPWLATADGLGSFEAHLPTGWKGAAYRMGRVEELGAGVFRASVLIVVGDAGSRGAPTRPMTLLFGPGLSIGGERMPLLLTSARR